MANELNVFYDGKSIPISAIGTFPQTTYALFRKGTIPNFAGPPISRDELTDRVKNSTLPKDQIEIMEFKMNLNDSRIAKILNTKHSAEVPNMRI